MAKIKTMRQAENMSPLIEDPIPGANLVYILRDAHDKNTLSPYFDKGLITDTTGIDIGEFGASTGFQPNPANAFNRGGRLQLTGETVHVTGYLNAQQGAAHHSNNLDLSPFVSMDPNNRFRNTRHWSNGTTGEVLSTHNYYDGATWRTYYIRWLNSNLSSTNLIDVIPTARTYWGDELNVYPIYLNPSTGNIVALTYKPVSDYTNTPTQGSRLTNVFTPGSLTYAETTATNGYSAQYVGVGSTGQAIILWNAIGNDYTQIIYRYNDSANTSTTLYTFNASPSAGGTSAGGNRGTSYGNTQSKYASSTFTTESEPTIKKFYIPYLDSNGNYHPLYFTWNTATDVFTRTTAITVNWGADNTQSTFWAPDTVGGGNQSVNYGWHRGWYNETFEYSGTRYLTFMQLHGAGTYFDQQPKMRTFVTFSIDTATPTTLTYHSSVEIPATPKNIVWLNDARTVMGIFTFSNFYVYSFNGTTWALIGTWNNQFVAVGRDDLGRVWAHDSGQFGWGALHLITLNVPTTISVVAPQLTYNYTGTDISSSLTVNAYNQSGQRIVANVKLVIDGGNMTFSGNNLTTTVTTSSSVNTTVSVTITGGGISNIVASVVL
jgi:hypothetical protein